MSFGFVQTIRSGLEAHSLLAVVHLPFHRVHSGTHCTMCDSGDSTVMAIYIPVHIGVWALYRYNTYIIPVAFLKGM